MRVVLVLAFRGRGPQGDEGDLMPIHGHTRADEQKGFSALRFFNFSLASNVSNRQNRQVVQTIRLNTAGA